MNLEQIKVKPEDKKRLLKECKKLYLEHNPEMVGIHLTHHFLFKKVIDFYLDV